MNAAHRGAHRGTGLLQLSCLLVYTRDFAGTVCTHGLFPDVRRYTARAKDLSEPMGTSVQL